jgi:hypothetical protein
MARNLKGAVASADAAEGGGNTVTPSGGTQANILGAETSAASQTATAENQIIQNDYAQGNQNYEEAVGQEEKLPDVFNSSTASENAANTATSSAFADQKQVDTESNWATPLITSAIGSAAGIATGGLTSGLSGLMQGGGQDISPTGWSNDMQTIANQGPAPTSTVATPDQIT